MSAYLGAILQDVSASREESAISSFEFLQAFDAKVGRKQPWNGEMQQDAKEFVDGLLDLIHEEEQAELGGSAEKPTLVQELFGVETRVKVCLYATRLAIQVVLIKVSWIAQIVGVAE